ncbi:MAG: 3-dehydroquinate synthase, partial [Chromatiales bacterium]|nr:3-dehydroquinate synthase [Chromatiales bacterium]
HPLGKNMIGAFYQPQAVIADTDTLNTLEKRQISAGLAEIIKYGLIRERPFFDWLEQHMEALVAREPAALTEAIERSCRCKADVVAADELEAGQRALLNLGHTFGHAIETGAGYGVWLHGEAVGAGMAMAGDLSQRLGWFTPEEQKRSLALMVRAGLPIVPPQDMNPERFLELMAVDKKVRDGHINLVLLKGIGEAVVSGDYPAEKLRDTLSDYGRVA